MTVTDRERNLREFAGARLGVFVHFGVYSLLGKGEWALNREQIPIEEYRALADRFTAARFDADALAAAAKDAGARYLNFTTMHHDGFALYDSQVNPFNSVKRGPKRDLVAEVVEACRKHGLRVHLYHSLNHWTSDPDAVRALEDEQAKREFIDFTHERIRELVTRFNPIECLWYDGWWPFDAQGWEAERMNEMVRGIQPHILFNPRNGLDGDFATPEQHLSAPRPWQPWEAGMTHNRHWGYHRGDPYFKSSGEVIDMLTACATGAGNLCINVGPDGEGAIPEPSRQMLRDVGEWMGLHEAAIRDTEPLSIDPHERGDHRGDWFSHGRYTAKDNRLFLHLLAWPGSTFAIGGLEASVQQARCLTTGERVRFEQQDGRVSFHDLPDAPPHRFGGVIELQCDQPPRLYLTGGLRTPQAPHPRYDPVAPDLVY